MRFKQMAQHMLYDFVNQIDAHGQLAMVKQRLAANEREVVAIIVE